MEAAPVHSVDEEIERHVKVLATPLQSGDVYGHENAIGALEDLAKKDNANRTAIAQRLVALVANGTAGGQESAARALGMLADDAPWGCSPGGANKAAIVAAGGIEALVALVANGAAGGQEWAAWALEWLAAENASNQAAIADAGGIEALVALVANGATDGGVVGDGRVRAAGALSRLAHGNDANRAAIATALAALVANGAAGGQEQAAWVLARTRLAEDAASQVAIVKAGGIEAFTALLANGSDDAKENAGLALKELGPLAEYASRLQSEKASLQRRLDRYEGTGKIDMTQDDDGDDDAQRRDTGLREEYDRATQEHIVEVKKEKADAEGARDRTDRVAAAASAAAATASADAREAAEELEDVHGDFVNPLTLTVNALQTKIDELHALAYQVDPVAADAIKNRQN